MISINCLLLGKTSFDDTFAVNVVDNNKIIDVCVNINNLKISDLKLLIWNKKKDTLGINDPDIMKLWKVDIAEKLAQRNIHIIVQVPVAGKCLPMIYQGQSVLKCVANSESEESAELRDKLVKKFELEHPELSNIFMKRTLIASGIPAINKRPLFVLHSYRTFQTIVAVKATSMKKCSLRHLTMLWKILGSAKIRIIESQDKIRTKADE
uniref:Uncharacterized protein n=1 Tax=Rhizophagus irregularis (strain DAOM 181602 / DAOM 197198 / MUCL 43194) TaxID=747089 RepID=U9SSI7_RHIID